MGMYPRVRAPLLPDVLIPLLGGEPVSRAVTLALGLSPDACLGQLDERVWVDLDRDAVSVLAAEVVGYVKRRWPEITRLQSTVSFGGATAADLQLSVRAYHGLLRYEFYRHHRRAGSPLERVTVCELASIRWFGALSLLDVLSAASEASRPMPVPSRGFLLAARSLARAPWSRLLSREDPRLGHLVRALDEDAATARAGAQRALQRQCNAEEERQLQEAIIAVTVEGVRVRALRLDEELEGIVAAVRQSERSRGIVIVRLGLDGIGPVTLKEAGRLAGVTRERVRQIEKTFRNQLGPAREAGGVWTPVLDGALQAIRHMSPTTSQQLQEGLIERGLIPERFSIESMLAAAKLLGKPITVYAEHGLISTKPLPVTPERIAGTARRLISHWGATTVDQVCVRLREETSLEVSAQLAGLLLETQEGFRWLDQRRGWFWIRATGHNRVLNQVEKILSVAPSISIAELAEGVGRHRHRRMRGLRLPRTVLARLCQSSERYERSGDRVLAKPGHPRWQDLLGESEATLVAVLFEHGPVMTRAALEQIAVQQRGMNSHSFTMYLSWSPVLDRPSYGVYRLRGS